MRAASSNSLGRESKCFFRMNTMTGATVCGRITAAYVSSRFSVSICWNHGTISICGGTRTAATVIVNSHLRPVNRVREKA